MAYSEEVVIRARARLAEAKADREAENREHQEIAYARVPRIREIDRQLRITMATAAQRIFETGVNIDEAMAEIRQKNLALQQERAALVAVNFEEGYLDDSPICPLCGGEGYVGSTMCECLQELCRQEQKKEISSLMGGKENFSQFKLSYYPEQIDPKLGVSPRALMERTFGKCQSYAMNFGDGSGNLLLSGETGLGKTFLSMCIARTVAERGYSVRYESAPHLFEKLQKAKFTSDEEAVKETEKLADCDLLVIDDLGTEYTSQATLSLFYTLLNDRMMSRKAMIVSTNLSMEELGKRYSPQIASRLRGGFSHVPFLGNDIRVLKNK